MVDVVVCKECDFFVCYLCEGNDLLYLVFKYFIWIGGIDLVMDWWLLCIIMLYIKIVGVSKFKEKV